VGAAVPAAQCGCGSGRPGRSDGRDARPHNARTHKLISYLPHDPTSPLST